MISFRRVASAPEGGSRAAGYWNSHSWTFAALPVGRRWLARLAVVATAASVGVPAFAASPAAAAPTGPDQSVIVRAAAGQLTAVEAQIRKLDGHSLESLSLINSVAADVPASAVAELRSNPAVAEVTDNGAVQLMSSSSSAVGSSYDPTQDVDSMYNIENMVGARQMWSAGYTGKGVDVALIDSGLTPVPGINANNLVYGPDLSWQAQQKNIPELDYYGHGTNMAGIIAGRDSGAGDVTQDANDTTHFLGMAPDARLVSVKVADGKGNTDVSQVIAGIDWVVQNGQSNGLNVRVINLSFGTNSSQSYLLDPLAYAAEQAWLHGIVVVVSAGNTGAASGRMTDPAIDPYVIAVGADDTQGTLSIKDDTVPSFSANGDGTRNPDLVAPGVHVQSLRDPNSYIDTMFASTGLEGSRFFKGSGTSQAAAVVSGAAALLLSEYPNLDPDQVKDMLVSNASPLPSASNQAQGAGLLQLNPNEPVPSASSAAQNFQQSTGTGSLEASRGSVHLVLNPANGPSSVLSGEQDIFGQAVDTTALAQQEANASAWNGGYWNSNKWTGTGWGTFYGVPIWGLATWSGGTWTSNSWQSSSWASSSWASSSWASSSWADLSWMSSSWA